MRGKTLIVVGVCVLIAAAVAVPLVLLVGGNSADEAGKRVAPAGGIYSFTVPHGFSRQDFNPRLYAGPRPGPDTSEVDASGDKNAIVVDVQRGFSAVRSPRRLARSKLASEAADARSQGYRVAAGHAERVRGRPAVSYELLGLRFRRAPGSSGTGVWDQRRVWIAVGSARVSVVCQWQDAASAARTVKSGCSEVLRTLRLRPART